LEHADISEIATAVDQVAGLIEREAARPEASAAAERIADVAFVLHERDVEASLCDALDAALHEVVEASARSDAAADRNRQAAQLLRGLASRLKQMGALAPERAQAAAAVAVLAPDVAASAAPLFDGHKDENFAQEIGELAQSLSALADAAEPIADPAQSDAEHLGAEPLEAEQPDAALEPGPAVPEPAAEEPPADTTPGDQTTAEPAAGNVISIDAASRSNTPAPEPAAPDPPRRVVLAGRLQTEMSWPGIEDYPGVLFEWVANASMARPAGMAAPVVALVRRSSSNNLEPVVINVAGADAAGQGAPMQGPPMQAAPLAKPAMANGAGASGVVPPRSTLPPRAAAAPGSAPRTVAGDANTAMSALSEEELLALFS
jgi:hypothetical protein